LIGQVVGNYRIISELGKGGMGIVYRAEHVQLGRLVAIKMLLPQLSNDAAIVQRFFNEARAASAIDHPGIVEIFDFGYTDGRAFLVMALLKGESLQTRLQSGPLPPLEGATIVAQVVSALAAAHARGIVHRDLKPDNIFLVPHELMPNGVQVKLLDFGIAKLAGDGNSGFKTQTGMLIGTPAYMSPEQCMGKSDLDHRTDLYSMGCILFHVLCGRPPFIGEGGTGMMIAAHLRDPAPHPRTINPQVPDALAAIVMRLLEKDPGARFQTATELRQALAGAGAVSPTKIPVANVDPLGQTMNTMERDVRSGEAYASTTAGSASQIGAPTTGAGSAAQLVPLPEPRRSKLPWIIGGTLIAAVAAVGVFVMMTREPATSPQLAAPAPPPPAVQADAAPAVAASAGGEPACPPGQARTDDTRGHCCWPEQAWSMAGQRCIGKPTCPPGAVARGEECQPTNETAKPARPPITGSKPDATVPAATVPPKLRLTSKTFAPGAPIAIAFASAVSSKTNNRTWVAIAEAGSPASSYGSWEFVADGATSAALKAPTSAGAYEVRVHAGYPAKPFNLQQAVRFEVTAAAPVIAGVTPVAKQRFSLASTTVTSGDNIEVVFPGAMLPSPGDQFWITVVAAGAPDTAWAKYSFVPLNARTMKVEAPTSPGNYEVRLHANYPKQMTNLVHRAKLRVE